MSELQQFLSNPLYHDLFSIIKGARNGFVYGCKIRFPHALVMTLLFSNRSWPEKVRAIYTATLTHAKNLAKFVTVYKLLLILQRRLRAGVGAGAGNAERTGVAGKSIGAKGVERGLDSFVAGLVGGYWVFGERTAINEQIVLYVSSRVLASFLPRLLSSASGTASLPPTSPSSSILPANLRPLSTLSPLTSKAANPRPIPPADTPFAIFAALSWGLVMYVYRHHGERLQPGMVNSMSYLYRDSEAWSSLKTLLWHNK
ncbi:peroxisomal membrane protein 4 [Filobasidium floriforme]|uniref:peroxisomal membrane protein 4 n=1 Tax=Filobasidium floriforme TaxID=5210 RepID=UPI001E8EDCEE|nr:peroxisomal membrane protein 4 [Filobasidium floriforme]KAH8082626.1 peroxisomal membrane protein 4 [Filobasidium floriforme]